MNELMGLIYTGENDSGLHELTTTRAVAALPVLGRYRVIDFQMSNLVNAGVYNVGVITQRNYHSLMDHLGNGTEWDLHGKRDGLFILPPYVTRDSVGVYGGMLDALHANMPYLRRSKQEYIALCHSYAVYNVDYTEMLRCHIESGADITVLCQKTQARQQSEKTLRDYIRMDENGLITEMEIDPETPTLPYESLEMLIMRREKLIEIVEQNSTLGHHSVSRSMLQKNINNKSLKIMGYEFKGRGWFLDTVQSYYKLNMDALGSEVRHELFNTERPIYTKVRDDPSAIYGSCASIKRSLIADGSHIDGTVENSILFRGVTVEKGAVVRNSIIMQDTVIRSGAELDHCIIDKQVTIRENGRLIGPESFPIVITKGMAV